VVLAANARYPLQIAGDFVRIREATGLVSIEAKPGRFTATGRAGLRVRWPAGWESIDLVDESGAPNTVVLVIGAGVDVGDDARSISGTVTTSELPGTLYSYADVSVPAGGSQQLVSASGQRAVIVSNPATNSQTMRLGDTGAASAEGIPLAPGETVCLPCNSIVRAYNPGGSAESLAVSMVF
jgi:hypothetical protein